jgi:hypothetical protein
MNFDTTIKRQQAPFSGAIAGEQAIRIQSSIAYFFQFFFFDFLLHLLSLIILKKKKINLI